MFKNLKKKLEQGVAQSPLRGALNAVTKVSKVAAKYLFFTSHSLIVHDS